MLKNKFKNIALSLAVVMGIGVATPVFAKSDYNPGDILALGSDLTDAQEAALRKYFNAPDGTNTIYVTDEVIIEQLGLDPNDPANYAGGCYSSAYVKLLDDDGSGKYPFVICESTDEGAMLISDYCTAKS